MERETRARAKLDRFQDKEFIIHASGIRFFGSIFLEISDRIGPPQLQSFDLGPNSWKIEKKFQNFRKIWKIS